MTTNELVREFKIGDLSIVLNAFKQSKNPLGLYEKMLGALEFEFHSDFYAFCNDNWWDIGFDRIDGGKHEVY